MMKRKRFAAIMAASILGVSSCASASNSDGAKKSAAAQVVKISAKRFEYNPREITLKKGTPVTLQLTTEDRLHGFSIPAMNVRSDIPPGKVTEVKLTPQKAGQFDFFCDIFCGSGHEGMNGKITVTD